MLAETCPVQWVTLHNIQPAFCVGRCGSLIVDAFAPVEKQDPQNPRMCMYITGTRGRDLLF